MKPVQLVKTRLSPVPSCSASRADGNAVRMTRAQEPGVAVRAGTLNLVESSKEPDVCLDAHKQSSFVEEAFPDMSHLIKPILKTKGFIQKKGIRSQCGH